MNQSKISIKKLGKFTNDEARDQLISVYDREIEKLEQRIKQERSE